jgi:hypothetical protein
MVDKSDLSLQDVSAVVFAVPTWKDIVERTLILHQGSIWRETILSLLVPYKEAYSCPLMFVRARAGRLIPRS